MATMAVTLHPVRMVHPCRTAEAERARGLVGFHDTTRCPACAIRPTGSLEAWGANGHCQGRYPVDAWGDPARILASLERRRLAPVELGWPVDYVGAPTDAAGPAYGIPDGDGNAAA